MLSYFHGNVVTAIRSIVTATGNPSSLKTRFFNAFLFASCLIYLLSVFVYLLRRYDLHQADLSLYYTVASRILNGEIPYLDFQLEYPAFALIPIAIPGIINHAFEGGFGSYCILFVLQNVCFCSLTGYIIASIRFAGLPAKNVTITYILICLCALPILVFRFDPFPVLCTSIVLSSVFRKPFISGMALAAGIFAKLYPLFMAPAIALYFLLNHFFKKGLFAFAGLFLLFAGAFSILLPIAGSDIFNFLHYHHLRGIQIESVAGGLLLLAQILDLHPAFVTHGFGSFNVESSVSATIAKLLTIWVPLIFTALLCLQSWLFIQEKHIKGAVTQVSVVISISLWVLSFLIFNKVLSPQYMIWLFPFIPFLSQKVKIKFVAALMLTISIFPGWYHYLLIIDPILVLLLNIRNVLLCWIWTDLVCVLINPVFQKTLENDETGFNS